MDKEDGKGRDWKERIIERRLYGRESDDRKDLRNWRRSEKRRSEERNEERKGNEI